MKTAAAFAAALLLASSAACGDDAGTDPGNGPGAGGDAGCAPQCSGKTCGDDGCGGTCGSCGQTDRCDNGACVRVCELLPVTTNQTLDLALKAVTVTGEIKLNGQPAPADTSERGQVVFTDLASGSSVGFSLGTTGAAKFSGKLYATTYKVTLDATSSYQKTFPRQQVLLAPSFDANTQTNLAVDLSTAKVTGTVRLNGAALPTDTSERGLVVFTRKDTGSRLAAGLGTTGAGTYTTTVFKGDYDVSLDATSSYQKTFPRQQVPVQAGLSIGGDFNRDLDLLAYTVSGAVTKNGGALPTDTAERGFVVFTRTDNASQVSFTLGTSGGSYTGKVFAGTYDVAVDSTSSYQKVLPRQRVTLMPGQVVNANASVNLDLKVVSVTGNVSLNGATMPTDTSERGSVVFAGPGGARASASFGASGAGAYSLLVYAGTYDLLVDSTSSYQKVLPRLTTRVRKAQVVSGTAQTVDVPLKTVSASGNVSVDGAAVPNDTSERGSLVFVLADTGSRVSLPLGTTGSARYSTNLYVGGYGVQLDSTSSYQKVLPRMSTTLVPLLSVTAPLAKDFGLQTVTLSGKVTLNGATLPSDTSSRGFVRLQNKLTGGVATADLGTAGNSWSQRVYAGSYDVSLDSTSSYQNVLPRLLFVAYRGCLTNLGTSCAASDKDLTGSWVVTYFAGGWGTLSLDLVQSGTTLGGSGTTSWLAGPVSGELAASGAKFRVGDANWVDHEGTLSSGCFMTGRSVAKNGNTSDFIADRLQ